MSATIPAPTAKSGDHRIVLMEELYQRYGTGTTGTGLMLRNFRFWRKKYAWLLVVGGATLIKRLVDIFGSLFLLMALSPLFLLVAILIKLTDRGPILFWQKRVGRWGREFDFPKFRSMVLNAEKLKDQLMAMNDHKNSITFKMKKDPRITWIGRFIRKGSIDELPQLWCVLKGQMSLVGPRPPVPREVEKYSLVQRRRLDVKPGLTSIWAVSGRGDIDFLQQCKLDVDYIESQSFWLDIKLLFLTVPAVLFGKGAY